MCVCVRVFMIYDYVVYCSFDGHFFSFNLCILCGGGGGGLNTNLFVWGSGVLLLLLLFSLFLRAAAFSQYVMQRKLSSQISYLWGTQLDK